jgi:hypothetical protein
VLKLFIKFEEEDILGKVLMTDKYYSKNCKQKKHFIPKNAEFQFISIYPRIRGLKILLRMFANIIFIFFASRLEKTINEQEEQIRRANKKTSIFRASTQTPSSEYNAKLRNISEGMRISNQEGLSEKKYLVQLKRLNKRKKLYAFLLKFLIRTVMSLDHVNIVSNVMFIGTSLRSGVSLFDFSIIFLDLMNLVYFQNVLYGYYSKHKD